MVKHFNVDNEFSNIACLTYKNDSIHSTAQFQHQQVIHSFTISNRFQIVNYLVASLKMYYTVWLARDLLKKYKSQQYIEDIIISYY